MIPSPVRRWSDSTFDSLGNPGFRILWIGGVLAFVAFFMSTIAQSVVAFNLTGNNRAVGSVIFGQGLAMIVLAPFGGALADRVSKRSLLLICQAGVGSTFLVLAALIAADAVTILYLAIGSFVIGTMFSLIGPARQAYMGVLVEPEKRGNAVALTQVALNTGRVAGPFVAAVLLGWNFVGTTGTYVVMGLMYLAAVATLWWLPPAPGRIGGGSGLVDDVLIGFRYVGANRRLRILITQFVLVMLAGFPFIAIMPAFVEDTLDSTSAAFGILMGVMAIGGLIASLLVAPIADSERAPQVLAGASAIFGVSLVALGISPSPVIAAAMIFFVGFSSGAFQTLNNALIVRVTDIEYYGRVMSLTMMAFAGFGVIALPIGFIADAVGERQTLVAMGIAVCAAIAIMSTWTSRALSMRPIAEEAGAPGR